MDGQWIRVVHSWLKLHGARAVESDLGIRSNSAVECRGHVHGPRECQVNVILKIIKRPDLTRLDITFYHYFLFGFGFGLGFCLEMFSYISWGGQGVSETARPSRSLSLVSLYSTLHEKQL